MILNFKKARSIQQHLALSLFVLFSLSAYANSFANSNSQELQDAIRNNNTESVESLLKEGADPNNIERFSSHPSLELAQKLLNNEEKPLDPNKFINLVLEISCEKYNFETRKRELDDELLEQQYDLAKLALEKGADPNSIALLSRLPTPELSKLLLNNTEKPLDPSKFLEYVLKAYDPPKEQQYSLAELALEKGADPNSIALLSRLPTPELSKLLLNNTEKPLDPSKFVGLVLKISCISYNSEKGKSEVDNELLEKQYCLVELALEKGADPNNIERFCDLPSLELSKLLLDNTEKPLDPSKFVGLVLKISCISYNSEKGKSEVDNELLEKQYCLVELALEKGADPNSIALPYRLPTPEFSKLLLNNTEKPLDPSKFLEYVLEAYDPPKEQQQQYSLAELALEKGADPNSIALPYTLPTPELSKLLLNNTEKPLDPSKFLEYVLEAYDPSKEQQYSLAELALKDGADPNNIESFSIFPSPELRKLLVENEEKPLDPNIFLGLILMVDCTEHTGSKERSSKTNEVLVQQRDESIMYALSKGANANSIEKFSALPSLKISELLFDNGLGPQKFLRLILETPPSNNYIGFLAERKKLEDFATKSGGSLNKIYQQYPEIDSAVFLNEQFIGRNQKILLDQLHLFFQDFHQPISHNLGESFKNSGGHCVGLTTLWLYSKWTESTQPKTSNQFNNEWFQNTTRIISSFENIDNTEKSDVFNFASLIDAFQFPSHYDPSISQANIIESLDQSILPLPQILKKKYTIASTFTKEQLATSLEAIAHDDALIYIMHPNHATGLFKHGHTYHFYDPNNNIGEYSTRSIEEIAEAIFNVFPSHVKTRTIGIMVYDFNDKNYFYPNKQSFLEDTTKLHEYMEPLHTATAIGCIDSFKFFLEQEPNLTAENNKKILCRAYNYNQPRIVEEILKNGANPNTSIEPIDQELYKPLLFWAAEMGRTEIARVLLADERTDINQKDSFGKTALDYASENKNGQVAELIRRELLKRQ